MFGRVALTYIVALSPFLFSITLRSTRVVNGVRTDGTSFDYYAMAAGALAIVMAISLKRRQARESWRDFDWNLAIDLVALLGAVQIIRGIVAAAS